MLKTIKATFPDRYVAWNAITEINRAHIVPRHEIQVESLDTSNPNGRTRLTICTKVGHEYKDSIAMLKKYNPTELLDHKGKPIK